MRARHYLRYLERELALQLAHLDGSGGITHMHWGGGTPTFLRRGELRSLMRMLRNQFEFTPAAYLSIEVDPRTVDAADKHQCDLIWMASHGRHGLDKLLHGNAAQGVVSHTKMPVLVMH